MKKKLIKLLKEKNPDFSQSELHKVLNILTENIFQNLKIGKIVEIRGLGRWYFKILKENFNARNPKTNELIYKPKRARVRFKASKQLNKIINK